MEALEAEKTLDLLICLVSFLKDGACLSTVCDLKPRTGHQKKGEEVCIQRWCALYYINVKRRRGSAKVMYLNYPACMAFTLTNYHRTCVYSGDHGS